MKQILVFLLCFVLFADLSMVKAECRGAAREVVIEVEKDVYKQGEEIRFEIINCSEEATLSFIDVSVEELVSEMWHCIRNDVTCPCGAKCGKRAPFSVKPGDTFSGFWDQKDDLCRAVLPGRYRIVIYGPWDPDVKRNRYISLSRQIRVE